MVQEVQKIEEKNRVLKSAKKLSDARDDIIDLLKKELFCIKVMYLKQKKKNQKRKESKKFSNTLRMKVLTMNCLKNIFILQYLVLW